MSLNFQEPVDSDVIARIKELLTVKANDDKTFLIDDQTIEAAKMKVIANAAKQPAAIELHGVGEIKELADGSRYRATTRGWIKIEPTLP